VAAIVIPFSGPTGKRRLAPLSQAARTRIAHAMLADVLAAAVAVGRTLLVVPAGAREARRLAAELGAETVDDPGAGQAEAVGQGLRAVGDGPALVINADVPCVQPADLLALLGQLPAGGLALVEAADGTTNAIALSSPRQFERLYGPGSAERFRRHADGLGVPYAEAQLPNLADDVDTVADLTRLAPRLGAATSATVRSALAPAA
jgi:2-phospho-L-lactate guanylyltransferase